MKTQEYLYNFKSGGWNSEYATNIEEAIIQAKKRWSNPDDVDETSFRVSTNEDYQRCMSLFH